MGASRQSSTGASPGGVQAPPASASASGGGRAAVNRATQRGITAALPAVERGRPIAVGQAGLILLWPFLSGAFARLGYQRGGDWFAGGQIRAVHWLHQLATGGRDAPEHRLVLAKVLCGMAVPTPIPRRVDLGDDEVQAGANLLADVVTHWSALKSTSPDGLRRGFIDRAGLLTLLSPDWRLRVERRAHDILLERLPWPYGTVRLRWTPYTLGVEW